MTKVLAVDTWSTRDMGLAAFIALEQPVLQTIWEDDNCFWLFEETDSLVNAVMAYSGQEEVMVSPRKLIKSYQQLNGALKREMGAKRR